MSGAGSESIRIALAQVNPTVGDVEGNVRLIASRIAQAREAGAQLTLFPELVITGYPPEDLLLKAHFLRAAEEALATAAAEVTDGVAVVGAAEHADGALYNSAAVLAGGKVVASYRKMLLPNYGVFDERRYFDPGDAPALIELGGLRVGLSVCEDIWLPGPPASSEALAGASLILNLSASPYHRRKGAEREEMLRGRARETGSAFAFCNAVGGQDELVFDGHSVVVDSSGNTVARAAQFSEELLICELELPLRGPGAEAGTRARPGSIEARLIARVELPPRSGPTPPARVAEPFDPEEAEVYEALKLGLRDYAAKNGFPHVVIALSGGIDSALVAAVATDALGAEHVRCVVMPSPHSSPETQADARGLGANLGVELLEIPIEPAMEAYEDLLGVAIADQAADAGAPGDAGRADLAQENIQARIRGNVVMALSNRFGWLVLTTGNKSELSVGYATLYGDMAGGFAVIKDVPKTLVYGLARWRNEVAGDELIPASIIERAPSAELRPDQRDEDSLPPYDVLDRILEAYVERDEGRDQIAASGIEAALVDEVMAMVDGAEYKRRQAPPGIRISPKAFGRDRRLPITNRFRG